MELRELKALVNQGEGKTIEFKRKATFPEKIVREMVAFANTSGGYLLVGVDDNGSIPGLKYLTEEKFALEKAIKANARPALRINISKLQINEKRGVLIYRIFESRKKPTFYVSNLKTRGIAYIRIDDKSVKASREMVEILRGQRRKKGVKIHYGNKEMILMQYLDKHQQINLSQFKEAASISKRIASNTLVHLVLANVLQISTGETTDWFSVKDQSII